MGTVGNFSLCSCRCVYSIQSWVFRFSCCGFGNGDRYCFSRRSVVGGASSFLFYPRSSVLLMVSDARHRKREKRHNSHKAKKSMTLGHRQSRTEADELMIPKIEDDSSYVISVNRNLPRLVHSSLLELLAELRACIESAFTAGELESPRNRNYRIVRYYALDCAVNELSVVLGSYQLTVPMARSV